MDIDTAPPTTHRENRPTMQLDLPGSEDVMEVDREFSLRSAPISQSAEANHVNPLSLAGIQNAPHVHSSSQSSPTARTLEASSPASRPLPTPPVVLIVSSDMSAWPKFKLDQLFVEWLTRPESKSWLDNLLEEARAGKAPGAANTEQLIRMSKSERAVSPGPSRSPSSSHSGLGVSPQQAPGSPVSRLFSKHIPFGDSDSSPRSPTLGPSLSGSQMRPGLTPPLTGDLDLGRSGSASPLRSDRTDGHSLISRDLSHGMSRTDEASVTRQPSEAPQLEESKRKAVGPGPRHGPDTKALDKVADGIAGMSAQVDKGLRKDTPEMKGESFRKREDDHMSASHVVEGESTFHEERMPLPISGGSDSSREQGTSSPGARVASTGTTSIAPPGTPKEDSEVTSGSLSLDASPTQVGHSQVHVASDPKKTSAVEQAQSVGQLPTADAVGMDTSLDGKTAPYETVKPGEGGRAKLISTAIPPSGLRLSVSEDATMTDSSAHRTERKSLPRFYFPCGPDAGARESREREAIQEFFKAQRSQKNLPGVSRSDIAELVVEVIGLPSYFASIIFNAIAEMFPTNGTGKQGGPSCERNMSPECKEATREHVMQDVSHKDDNSTQKQSSPHIEGAARGSDQATKSDTTMGDATDSRGEARQLNGFHSSPGGRGASAEISRDPTSVRESTGVHAAVNNRDFIAEEQFTSYYNAKCSGFSKEARLFNALLEPGATRMYLVPNDFKPLLRALLMCHQGLAFLHATPEFQQRYSETVIERIYFGCTRQHNGRLTLQDIKRSKLLDTLRVVDEEEDINRERRYFSYEHFYVLYCRFWELDANHDLQIDREDLMRYGSHSLTYRIVDRIFGGYARPLDTPENPGFMSYTDFIWFCLSEEDKTSDTAIDYWFRCVDMDGDGLITMYDMEFFYKEQLHRMECFGHEPVQIRDILCQLLDMINPKVQPPVIRRRDLKRCRLAGNFFNVLFNLNKFFAIEARDPLQIRQEHATPELTDWDRFAALEYLRLSAEEEGEEDESWEDVGEAANPLMAGEAPF